MTRALLLLLPLLALPALAQDRPTVRHYARPGCGDCAAITSAVRGLEQRWGGRVAAVIAARPKVARHGHDVELFLRPTRDSAELKVTLRWTDAFGQPTLDPDGQVNVRVGGSGYGIDGALRGPTLTRHGGWTLLQSKLSELRAAYRGASPWGRPIVLDADRRVPRAHLLRALEAAARAVAADVKRWPAGTGAIKIAPRKRVEPPEPSPPAPVGATPPAPKTPSASAAVAAALAWLVRHQAPDGSWGFTWRTRCRKGACPKGAARSANYQVGLTALALLAFEGGGHTRLRGKHRAAVTRGVNWLLKQQRADGTFGPMMGEQVYNQAVATAALCRLAGANVAARAAAQKGLDWIARARNPRFGWKYGPRSGRNDTSVTVWMVQALAMGRAANLRVPPAAFVDAERWVLRATSAAGETGYESPAGGSSYFPQNDGKFDTLPVMTAAGIRVRQIMRAHWSQYPKSVKLVERSLPSWPTNNTRRCNFYYWYWGTEVFQRLGGGRRIRWQRALEGALLPNQVKKGCAAGSWPPVGEWCLAGGRIYATAINALSLTAPRRLKKR